MSRADFIVAMCAAAATGAFIAVLLCLDFKDFWRRRRRERETPPSLPHPAADPTDELGA